MCVCVCACVCVRVCVCMRVCICVTEFSKTRNTPAKTEIQIMAWHKSNTLALSRCTNGRATNKSTFIGIINFCDPVISWKSTMECMMPLGCTNKATVGIKLSAVSDRISLTSERVRWLSVHFNVKHNGCFYAQMYGKSAFSSNSTGIINRHVHIMLGIIGCKKNQE